MATATDVIAPAMDKDGIKGQEIGLARRTKPYSFRVRAQLLDQGRTDTVLAATEDLTMRIKVYASGGENELHAHPHEDHLFVILQGSARFHGPSDESVELGPYEGFMVPKGNFYRFLATGTEPLVLLRVGSPGKERQAEPSRINIRGEPMEGESKENRTFPVIFREGAYFG